MAYVQHIQLPTHTSVSAWYECTLTSADVPKGMQTQESVWNMKFQVDTHVLTSNEAGEAYKCSAWKPFLRSYTMRNNCTCSPLEDASEDAFARGQRVGLGSANFKFLGMKLRCM